MTRGRKRLLVGYSVWMAALTGIYYRYPDDRIVWWTGIGLSGAAAILLGVRLNRPTHPAPWVVLAAANLSFTAGEVVQVVETQYLHQANPFPSVADVFYLMEYVLYAVGVLLVIRLRTADQDRGSLIDALILTAGLGLLFWVYLVQPDAAVPGLNWTQKAISVAYPLGDVLVLAILLRLLVPRAAKSPALLLLTAGTVGLLAADVAYGLIQLHGDWRIGTPVDLGWAALYFLWGAAALHPSMVELTHPVPAQPQEVSRARLTLLTAASLIAPGLLLVESLLGNQQHSGVIAVFSAVLFLLVLARLDAVVAVHRHALARERALRLAGAGLSEAVTVNDVADAVTAAVRTLRPEGSTGTAYLRVQRQDEKPPTETEETRLVPVSDLGPIADSATESTALVCPMKLAERPAGGPSLGELIVVGSERELIALWGSLEILTAQATLAVERVMLNQEINRRNSETYFRTLVQNASDVILILDPDDAIRFASGAAERVLGFADLGGVHLSDLAPVEDSGAVLQALSRMRGRDAPQHRVHWRLLRRDGTGIEVEVRSNDLSADSTVGGLVLTLRDVTEQRQMERELTHQAFHDSLTGLANRVLFQDRVAHAVTRSERTGVLTGVLFLDLDDFKVVNDTQGHAVGDELLVAVSLRLSTALRESDTAARLGGDEFAVLVEDARTAQDVQGLADAVLEALAEPFRLSAGTVRIGASMGIALTDDSFDAAELLTHADLALYSAKAGGKRQWHRYQPALQRGLVHRHELGGRLDSAIADSAFTLEYQPIVELAGGDLVGFEALVRWPHSEGHPVPPEEFISLAEESGQIVPLGAWVLERAVEQTAQWQRATAAARSAAGRAPLRVSVNVSARQFRDAGFVHTVHEAVERTGMDPQSLTLELTESVLMRRDDHVREDMRNLGELGVRLAIDDFGTGYSSLSYLREFPISILKIDKSFIDGLGQSPQQYALVEGISRIADTLGVEVIAEGIETTVQRDLLATMGCPMGQGYLFARPLTVARAEQLAQADAAFAGLQTSTRIG